LITFFSNSDFLKLAGPNNSELDEFEKLFGVKFSTRGLTILVQGKEDNVQSFLKSLEKFGKDPELSIQDIKNGVSGKYKFYTYTGKCITPKTPNQETYIEKILSHQLTFGVGPAGTGKTFLAVALAVKLFQEKNVDRIVVTRPVVEAGEHLGFLPGEIHEKVDPYLRPIYDSLQEFIGKQKMEKLIEAGLIEIAPLAYMRGRTLSNSFVILDEAQNTTPIQMKMFLTRIGQNSKVVVTGDITQADIGSENGLKEALRVLRSISEIAFVFFSKDDVVREKLVEKIIEAYSKSTRKAAKNQRIHNRPTLNSRIKPRR